jgi:hypothetical protein
LNNPGVALILVAIVLIGVGMLLGRRRNELAESQGFDKKNKGKARQAVKQGPALEFDVAHPRPRVTEMHVHDNEAQVTFDVPFPESGDDVLADILVQEAIEVVREKRHTLPMDMVHRVTVFAGRGGERRQVGQHTLDTPGSLPPRIDMPSLLNLSPFARDPLEGMEDEPFEIPEVAAPAPPDELAPLATEIKLPKAIDMGLRAQGVDPASMTALEMVNGTLKLFGYRVAPGPGFGMFIAEKAGSRTFIQGDTYRAGDHPQIDEQAIDRFMVDFSVSGCDRGLLVSEKYARFECYDRERREPRVRFVTRERLQKMIDSLALS